MSIAYSILGYSYGHAYAQEGKSDEVADKRGK